MAKIKYLVIDTLSTEDTNAMCEAVCKNIIGMSSLDVKRKILKIPGKDEALKARKFTLNELLSLISTYDISTEIKLTYVDTEFSEAPVVIPKESISVTGKAIEEQKSEVKTVVAEPVVRTDDLPDAPDFMD